MTGILWMTACSADRRRPDLDSAAPGDKLYAIQKLGLRAESGRRASRRELQQIIEQLESDDPAVRMMAAMALEKHTGQRRGYDPYAGLAERQAAVDGWTRAVRRGEFDNPARSADAPVKGRVDSPENEHHGP